MHSNVNPESVAGALGFAGASLALAVVFVHSLLTKRRGRSRAALRTRLIVGHEDSLLHGKTRFGLGPRA